MSGWRTKKYTRGGTRGWCPSFALEQTIRICRADAGECFFWATHSGAELDLLIVQGARRLAFEFKYSSAPRATRSMRAALEALDLDALTIIHPGAGVHPLSERIRVAGLADLAREMQMPSG